MKAERRELGKTPATSGHPFRRSSGMDTGLRLRAGARRREAEGPPPRDE